MNLNDIATDILHVAPLHSQKAPIDAMLNNITNQYTYIEINNTIFACNIYIICISDYFREKFEAVSVFQADRYRGWSRLKVSTRKLQFDII